jgi:hypothetical protein
VGALLCDTNGSRVELSRKTCSVLFFEGGRRILFVLLRLREGRLGGNDFAVPHLIDTGSQGPKLFAIILWYHSIFGQLFRGSFLDQIHKIQIFVKF